MCEKSIVLVTRWVLETFKLKESWTKLTRLGNFSFAKKKSELEFLMNKIARTNKNISEVNLIRKLFLDTNTKSFSFILGSSKKAWTTSWFTYFFVQIFLFHSLLWWIVQKQFFRHAIFLGPKTGKMISIQILLSIAKFVDSLIQKNVRSKLRMKMWSPVHRFWQLFLFQSCYSHH